MSGNALRAAAVKDASLMDALTDNFAEELGVVVEFLTVKVRTLVKKLKANPDGRIIGQQQNLALALRLRTDLIAALEAAGYTDLALRAVDAPLDRLAAQVLKGASQEAVALSAFDVDALVAMKEIRFATLLQIGEGLAVDVWRLTLDGVLGARPVVDLVTDLSDLLDTSFARARTIYDTALSTFSRQVGQFGTTGEPEEAFLYVGPDDEKTRPFCEAHVDRVYSRAAIEEMDNGQLPDVMLTGGGFNCRHQFKRVSKLDTALLELVDTDVRYQDRKVAA